MTHQRAVEFLRMAQAEGLLPESATLSQPPVIQWPIILMTSIGAWLATIPLVGVIYLMSDGQLTKAPGGYVLGILMLAAGLYLLKNDNLSVFLEQFILAALVLVGLVHMGFGIRDEFSEAATCLLMAPVTLAVGWLMPRRWLQCAFAALACFFLLRGLEHSEWESSHLTLQTWDAAMVALCVWIAFHAMLRFARPTRLARIDAIAAGWGAALLAALVLYGGSASFFAATFNFVERLHWGSTPSYSPALSVLLTIGAAGWTAVRWPTLARARFVPVAVIAAVLAWYMPALGGIFVVLTVCATSGRYLLAGAAGVAAVLTLSHFYYYLAVPLTTKALIVTAAATVLAAVAWLRRPLMFPAFAAIKIGRSGASAGIFAGMLIVLAAINASIWQKEHLIRTGTPVLVALAPVDPRSLLQGDYMRLRFELPAIDYHDGPHRASKVVGAREQSGVTRLSRFDDGGALKPGELRINLVRKNGTLTLVTDAWFFAEGEAERWEAASYGEFRVDESGNALLVGMRDDKLRPIR